ncbi:hypothetical protein E4L96_00435 [Massilia arenosa]|uniref:Lipoprotein n=2 Tax=Zemynaea arenosa TaxID=2561931 RepID=A0A4Y9SU76_9BURK|nr:hypothetical protein E4L96_00435 [Massilia arenosa]
MSRMRAAVLALVIVLAAGCAWAALAPVPAAPNNEEIFTIPAGTWDKRMEGDRSDILPRVIHLTLKLNDVLVVRNQDKVPQTVGPVLIMPGQQFRMPFSVASENQFDCTAHSDGQLTVLVDDFPEPGLARLAWRLRRAFPWLNSR